MKNIIVVFLSLVFVSACGSSKEVAKEESTNSGLMVKKDYHSEGYTWVVVTKEHSEDDCGFLLKNKDSEELQLFIPIEWKGPTEAEGEEFWIKYNTSRIKQEGCFNATPIVITDFKL